MSYTKLMSYSVKNHIPNVFLCQFKWILFINIRYYEIKTFGMRFLKLYETSKNLVPVPIGRKLAERSQETMYEFIE